MLKIKLIYSKMKVKFRKMQFNVNALKSDVVNIHLCMRQKNFICISIFIIAQTFKDICLSKAPTSLSLGQWGHFNIIKANLYYEPSSAPTYTIMAHSGTLSTTNAHEWEKYQFELFPYRAMHKIETTDLNMLINITIKGEGPFMTFLNKISRRSFSK